MPVNKLVFVYAVDGGFFNSLSNYAHMLLSPSTYQCNLCALTDGALGPKKAWTKFLKELHLPTEFLHRNELAQEHPTISGELPAVYVERDGELQILITREEITRCRRLEELISLVRDKAETVR
jgi:hypothetical protein